MQRNIVTVEKFYNANREELDLKVIAGRNGLGRAIREPAVNRPGLALAGFTRYFAHRRVQIIGSAESSYLKTLEPAVRAARYSLLLGYKIPCLVLCRSLNADAALLRTADQIGVPLFKSPLITMNFINAATLILEAMFAPHSTELGSMVDILGIGVIIKGESGIGKSECVLGLIERGYSLVSDDVTRVTLSERHEVIGTSPEITRNFMEVRGIGILNVQQLFGVKSVRTHKKVDLVVTLKPWEEVRDVDRLGMEQELIHILGVPIPHMVIPVRPGRDVARLIEVAAFYVKMKNFGLNPANDFNKQVMASMNGRTQSPPA